MSDTSFLPEPIIPSPSRHLRNRSSSRTGSVLLAAVLLLGILAAEEWLSIRHLSITVDEGAHTYAGYEHWKTRDFGVNPEHPPLVKLIATAPLLRLQLHQPHPPPINFLVEQYVGGSQLYSQNNGEVLLQRARTAASLLTFLLAVLVFLAAFEIFGRQVALLALALFTFEPTVLAHGALVTTDMGVACFLFAAFYSFYRFLKRPSLPRLLLCGVVVGFALAAKVSGVLAIPILGLLAMADVATAPSSERVRRTVTLLVSLTAIFFLGYATLWSFYTFRYAARPGSLTLTPTLTQMASLLPHPWEAALIQRMAAWHLLPEGYLYAWAKLLGNVTGMPGFLFGRLYPTGTWIYFPSALLIKSSLTLLLLLAVSPFVLKRLDTSTKLPILGIVLTLLVILLACMGSPLDIGIRHALAMYPFAIVLAAVSGWALITAFRFGAVTVALLLVFQCVSALHSYPDYLPYANEAFGGPSKTYLALTDSNVDWGQQLKEVRTYLNSHHTGECWFAYSNMAITPESLPCKALPTGLALVAGQPEPIVPVHLHGTVLISAVDASGAIWGPGDLNPYRQFQLGHPAELIGNSILLYQGDFEVPLVAAESHMSQVPLLLRKHQFDAALNEAATALRIAPHSPMIEAAMGGTYLQLGRTQEARQAFDLAMQETKEHGQEESKAVAARVNQLVHPNL